VPYKSTFMCEKSVDFGQCMDVQSAYDEALANGKLKEGTKESRYRDSSASHSRGLHHVSPDKAARAAVLRHDAQSIPISQGVRTSIGA